jgi:hypothetical protein
LKLRLRFPFRSPADAGSLHFKRSLRAPRGSTFSKLNGSIAPRVFSVNRKSCFFIGKPHCGKEKAPMTKKDHRELTGGHK